MTSQFSTFSRNRNFNLWQADIYDFNSEVYTVEVEAADESEAYSKALDAAASLGIQADFISINRY